MSTLQNNTMFRESSLVYGLCANLCFSGTCVDCSKLFKYIYILTYLANWARTVDQPAYIPVGQLAQRLVQDWENCWRKMVSMLWYWSSWKSSLMVHQMVEYLPKPDEKKKYINPWLWLPSWKSACEPVFPGRESHLSHHFFMRK